MWWRGASTSLDHCSLNRDTYWANSSLSFMSLARDAYPPVACNRLSQDMSREAGRDGLNQELELQVERLCVRPCAENRAYSSASIQRNPVKRSIRCSSTYSGGNAAVLGHSADPHPAARLSGLRFASVS